MGCQLAGVFSLLLMTLAVIAHARPKSGEELHTVSDQLRPVLRPTLARAAAIPPSRPLIDHKTSRYRLKNHTVPQEFNNNQISTDYCKFCLNYNNCSNNCLKSNKTLFGIFFNTMKYRLAKLTSDLNNNRLVRAMSRKSNLIPSHKKNNLVKISNSNTKKKVQNNVRLKQAGNSTKIQFFKNRIKVKSWPESEVNSSDELAQYENYTQIDIFSEDPIKLMNDKPKPNSNPDWETGLLNIKPQITYNGRPPTDDIYKYPPSQIKPMYQEINTNINPNPVPIIISTKTKHPSNTITTYSTNSGSNPNLPAYPIDPYNTNPSTLYPPTECPTVYITALTNVNNSNAILSKEGCSDLNIIINSQLVNHNVISGLSVPPAAIADVPHDEIQDDEVLNTVPIETSPQTNSAASPAIAGANSAGLVPIVPPVPPPVVPPGAGGAGIASGGGHLSAVTTTRPPQSEDSDESVFTAIGDSFYSVFSWIRYLNPLKYDLLGLILTPISILAAGGLSILALSFPWALPGYILSRSARKIPRKRRNRPKPKQWYWHDGYQTWASVDDIGHNSYRMVEDVSDFIANLIEQYRQKYKNSDSRKHKVKMKLNTK